MTLTEMRYIIALAREKHFGRAASLCHVSQPALSVAINKLENELGVLIFERYRNEVKITDVGQQIITQAQRILDEAAKIKIIANSKQSQLHTPLKIGAIYTVGPYLFPMIIPKLKKIARAMPLLIQEGFTADLKEKLLQGELDVIFISLPFSESGMVIKTLYDEPFVILLPQDHALNKKQNISIAELEGEEILLLGEGHCFRKQVIEACPHCYRDHASQRAIEGTSLETLRYMVASGMGITILPSTAANSPFSSNKLCTKPFKGKPPKRTIALVWRASFTRPKAITALIEALKISTLHGVCLL